MAGMLSIETDQLRSAVQTAQTANEEISSAMNCINQVTEHNDWVCRERDRINQFARENRSRIQTLKSDAESFYLAVRSASEAFDEAESTQIQKQQTLESLLAGIMNVTASLPGSIGAAQGSSPITSFSNIADSF